VLLAGALRALARARGFPVDVIEKDYVLGWLLVGICRSRAGAGLALKGGTALSKVYFPGAWRLSEDLDFTFLRPGGARRLAGALATQLPSRVREAAPGLRVVLRDPPHVVADDYLQARFRFDGPIGAGTIKVEASREDPVGPVTTRSLPASDFDYPRQRVRVYSIENMVAEKLRAMAERRRVRDYYDVWKLVKVGRVDWVAVRRLFPEKCRFKGVSADSLDRLFPRDLESTLGPYLRAGLTRLTPEPLPPLSTWLRDLRRSVSRELKPVFRARRD